MCFRKKRMRSYTHWVMVLLYCFFIVFTVLLSWKKRCVRRRCLGEEINTATNACKNIIPFYLNSDNFFNILREINLSNNFSMRWNINYIYFEYFNEEFFINFNLHSTDVKSVELYEYKHKSILLLKKDVQEFEVNFFTHVEADKSIYSGEKRIFYFIIQPIFVSNFNTCMNITLELNIGVVKKSAQKEEMSRRSSSNGDTSPSKVRVREDTDDTVSNYFEKTVEQEKKTKLPAHHKNYIIVKDNYYYTSNEDYYVRFDQVMDESYTDLKKNQVVIIIYSVLFFTEFSNQCNISFYSHVTEDISVEKNFFMELKKMKLSKNYLHNMSVQNVLKFSNLDKECKDDCIKSKRTKNGIFMHAPLENNSVYKFEVKYIISGKFPNGLKTNSNGAHFSLEFSIVNNTVEYSMVDIIREHFNSECTHNTFFPSEIIQIDFSEKNENIFKTYLNERCKEEKKESCNVSNAFDDFVIYGRMIELNDNFIFNFDHINLFEEIKRVRISISEESLFSFVLTSKENNVYINLLKRNSSQIVCNTYYLNNLKDYSIFSYITKDMATFPHAHVNETFADLNEDERMKKFAIHNVVYINCALSKGEYDLKIKINGHNMICDSNEVNILIHPISMYEERHKCDSSMNVITDLFYYHLRTENKKEKEQKISPFVYQEEGFNPENKILLASQDVGEISKKQENTKKYQNIYESRWVLNNPIFHNFDFVILHEQFIGERVDELIVTVNNSIFVDLFFVIMESTEEKNPYYYIYKNSRNVSKYKIKHNKKPFTIYIFSSNMHYTEKQLCGFFFIDIDFLTKVELTQQGKNEYNNNRIITNMHNFVKKINYIPDLIIGYDSYSFSNFCFIPKFKKHILTIYVKENSIIKINCFTSNYVYIYLYDQNKNKLYDGYNHLYIESFTKGEYEIVLEFNSKNDNSDSAFFYLQIYIYHLNSIQKCIFAEMPREGSEAQRGGGEEEETSGRFKREGLISIPPIDEDVYNLSSYGESGQMSQSGQMLRAGNTNQAQENDKNSFFFQIENSYYLFKRYFIVLFPNRKFVKELILPHVRTLDPSITFFLKIELFFPQNYFPYKLTIQDSMNSLIQYHDSYTYKNKILMTLPVVNNAEKKFKLYVDMYEDVNENLMDSYCTYAYLHIVYTSEFETFRLWKTEEGLSQNTINMPLLLNNILFRSCEPPVGDPIGDVVNPRSADNPSSAISADNPSSAISADNVNSGKIGLIRSDSIRDVDHDRVPRISFNNFSLPIMNQNVQCNFEMINNNVFLFLANNNVFFNMYMYRENSKIRMKIYKYSNTDKLENRDGITYEDVSKNSSSHSEEIFFFSDSQIYLSTYLQRGLYIFEYERESGPFFVNLSLMWYYHGDMSNLSQLGNQMRTETRGLKYEMGTPSSLDMDMMNITDSILKKEIYFLFGTEMKCNEKTKFYHENRKLDNLSFFLEEIVKDENFRVYDKSNALSIDVKKGEELNLLIYKRFYICLLDKRDDVIQQKGISNNTQGTSSTIEKNYTIFSVSIEENAKVYVEINPHYHFFVYPFNLNVMGKRSFFNISSGYKNSITIDLHKGEYEIHLSFPNLTKGHVKGVIFDLLLLIISSEGERGEHENGRENGKGKEGRSILTSANKTRREALQNDKCNTEMYKPLFNKINMIDIEENDTELKKNIISPKFKYKYFHIFDKFFIKNYVQEVFFTIPSGGYVLKIFCVPIEEFRDKNVEIQGVQKQMNGSYNLPIGNFFDVPNDYVNSYLNVRNVFNIRVILDESVEEEEEEGNRDNKKDYLKENVISVLPMYANENEEYMLNLYKVDKNFKLIVKTNSYTCNYFQLIMSLYPLDFYNAVHNYTYANYIEKYLKNIFDTLSVKVKLYDGINFEQKKFSSYQYTRVSTSVINLRSVTQHDFFSFPLPVQKASYIKINIGYDFSLSSFEMKLLKNSETLSNSNKVEVNLKDNSVNMFENISLYLEKGDYTLQIFAYDLIGNSLSINKNFSFAFYFELEIFEFSEEKNRESILLDIFPHNSMIVDRNYSFVIDLIFWGNVNDKDIYLKDGHKENVEEVKRQVIKYANVEIHKFVLLPKVMSKMEINFFFKFNPSANINVSQEKEKKLIFILSSDSINLSNPNSTYEMGKDEGDESATNKSNERNSQVHQESVNNSLLLEFDQKEVAPIARDQKYPQEIFHKDVPYDIDNVIKNYRMNEKKRRDEEDFPLSNSTNKEKDECIPLNIFSVEIYCFGKSYFLTFIFFICFLFMLCAFIFVLLKLYKNWKYYRNYDIIVESEEVANLFDDDNI
ncbi:hypothetical protein, conserved [Plasmodium gonderi]|uniref:Uncharacterized protein n=1 Tax=Plasmodium gonderi TaxID=77519 RepID=A0A1Y1JDP8_PLAGO|nr:hypothetical protein, conserved [Plasmodium gonderi]GAW79818.1 hypothetical protein, conserved [Plasmodium gonderi]